MVLARKNSSESFPRLFSAITAMLNPLGFISTAADLNGVILFFGILVGTCKVRHLNQALVIPVILFLFFFVPVLLADGFEFQRNHFRKSLLEKSSFMLAYRLILLQIDHFYNTIILPKYCLNIIDIFSWDNFPRRK